MARSTRWRVLGDLMARVNRTRGYGDYYHYHRMAAAGLAQHGHPFHPLDPGFHLSILYVYGISRELLGAYHKSAAPSIPGTVKRLSIQGAPGGGQS